MSIRVSRASRRAALMALAGTSVAAVLGRRGGTEAGPVNPLVLATMNSAGATTELRAANTFTGISVLAVSSLHENHTALRGTASGENSTGVEGSGGLRGVGGFGQIGVLGDGLVGVKGVGGPPNSIGVYGLANEATGVAMRAENGAGTALQAIGETRLDGATTLRGALRLVDPGSGNDIRLAGKTGPAGVALRVDGPVSFKTSGTARFTKGRATRSVTGVATPPGVRILVTLNQNPGPGNALKYVKRTSDNGFTAYLLKPVTGGVEFSWFVIV